MSFGINDECKKAKGTENCVLKRELKFKDYKKILKDISYFKDSLKEKEKEFIRNWLTLKTQQRFKIERHNVFTKERNGIAISSNDEKRLQSIDSIETYGHGMSKDLIWKKEKN